MSNTITIKKAREVLGKTGENMSDADIQNTITLMDELAGGFLDNYERTIFKGKTVDELINGKVSELSKDKKII